jgi:hypothetical protein
MLSDVAKTEGKIKGRGTSMCEKPVCTWGWHGTRWEVQRAAKVGNAASVLTKLRALHAGLRRCWMSGGVAVELKSPLPASLMLASGRYAMLDDGMGFSLVPWRPVIEQRLGQQIAATVRGSGVSWEVGRTPTRGV